MGLTVLAYQWRRQSSRTPTATLWQGGAPIQALAFDDPWIAAACGDGATLLLNADAAMRSGGACPGNSVGRSSREAATSRYAC